MRAIMYVETQLQSPDLADAYHQWYNEVHLEEIVAVDGFLSARRFEPAGHEGPFIAIYEIDAEDIEVARKRVSEALASGSRPVGVVMDPPPVVRYYREIAEYKP